MKVDWLITLANQSFIGIAGGLVVMVWIKSGDIGSLASVWVGILIIILLLIVLVRPRQYENKFIYLVLSLLVGVVLGNTISTVIITSPYKAYFGEEVSLVGEIVSQPELRSYGYRFHLQPFDVEEPAHSKVLVSTDLFTDLEYGDVVTVLGTLSAIENFTGDTGREFNYEQYLAVRGVSAKIDFAHVSNTGEYVRSITRTLSQLKGHYLQALSDNLPEPASSLAGGITVGANDVLGESVDTLFRRVGLTHIVVLSGYNVAIVILALSSALAFLPYLVSLGVSLVGIWLFVLLVGASTTIVRAGIMASIAVVSRLYGSEVSPLAMLSVAVIVMVLLNPLIVRFDPSFQLSVLATIGIIQVTPIIEPYFKKVSEKLGLREILVTTLATQITVIPWIVYLMGEFSIVSPLANVLVLPIIPWAMAASFLIYVFSFFSDMLIKILTFVAYALLTYIFKVSEALGSWSLASLSVPPLSLGYIALIYLLITTLLYKIHLINQRKTAQ